MANRLVQEDARPAGSEHHSHVAGRRRNRVKVDQGGAHGLAGNAPGPIILKQFNQVIAATATTAAGFAASVLFNDDLNIEAHQRSHIGGEGSVGSSDKDGIDGR